MRRALRAPARCSAARPRLRSPQITTSSLARASAERPASASSSARSLAPGKVSTPVSAASSSTMSRELRGSAHIACRELGLSQTVGAVLLQIGVPGVDASREQRAESQPDLVEVERVQCARRGSMARRPIPGGASAVLGRLEGERVVQQCSIRAVTRNDACQCARGVRVGQASRVAPALPRCCNGSVGVRDRLGRGAGVDRHHSHAASNRSDGRGVPRRPERIRPKPHRLVPSADLSDDLAEEELCFDPLLTGRSLDEKRFDARRQRALRRPRRRERPPPRAHGARDPRSQPRA